MIARDEALELLLATRLAWLPAGRVASTYADISGPAGGDRVRCGRCGNTGRVQGEGVTAQPCGPCRAAKRRADETGARFTPGCSRCRPCLLCDGTGWRPLIESEYDDNAELRTIARTPMFAGETGEDEYLRPGKHGLWASAHTKAEARRRMEALISALEEQRRIRAGEAVEVKAYGWERDRDAHYKAGSYRDLDQALERLFQRSAVVSHAVWQLYVYEPHIGVRQPSFRGALERTARVGFAWLLEAMPDPMRVPPWLLPERDAEARKVSLWRGRGEQAEQRAARDAEIRRLAQSLSVGELCARFALGRSQVYAILADDGAAVASGPAA